MGACRSRTAPRERGQAGARTLFPIGIAGDVVDYVGVVVVLTALYVILSATECQRIQGCSKPNSGPRYHFSRWSLPDTSVTDYSEDIGTYVSGIPCNPCTRMGTLALLTTARRLGTHLILDGTQRASATGRESSDANERWAARVNDCS